MAKTCKQFCQTYEKKFLVFQKNLIALLSKNLTSDDKKKIKENIKKNMNKEKKKIIKMIARECNRQHCNKSCKNTIFEAGKNKYPTIDKDLAKKPELKKLILKLQKSTKKRLFGNKNDILKDNFYEKLSSAKVKQLKKEGAISGCIEDFPPFMKIN